MLSWKYWVRIKWITVIEIIVENKRFPNLKIFKSMTNIPISGTNSKTI